MNIGMSNQKHVKQFKYQNTRLFEVVYSATSDTLLHRLRHLGRLICMMCMNFSGIHVVKYIPAGKLHWINIEST